MGLGAFLTSLSEHGRAQVEPPEALLDAAPDEVNGVLAGLDALARDELAFTAPTFSLDVTRWAAELLYRGCQCLVYRQLDGKAVQQALRSVCPRPLSAEAIYSADLVLRYLVDLSTMARAVAERDVLVEELERLGAAWPLSSVGMPRIAANQLNQQAVEIIRGNRSLTQLYVDRVIGRRDSARLQHSWVREAVREAIGLYDELWPEAMKTTETNS